MQTEDHYQINNVNNLPRSATNGRFNNGSRYAIPTNADRLPTSDSVIPLIPERKSSNNEQVLDWMKSFNIPKRPIAATTNVRTSNRPPITASTSRYPISPSSPRVAESDGTWKFVRRRPGVSNSNSYMVTERDARTKMMEKLNPFSLLYRTTLSRSLLLHRLLNNSLSKAFMLQKIQTLSTAYMLQECMILV